MDYSKINSEVKEDMAERIAKPMSELWNLQFEIQNSSARVYLINALRELKTLVDDLGGHPATDSMPL